MSDVPEKLIGKKFSDGILVGEVTIAEETDKGALRFTEEWIDEGFDSAARDGVNLLSLVAAWAAAQKGWTADDVPAFVNNLHGEVSELWFAAANGSLNEPCEKTNNLTNLEEELADIFIRLAHFCGANGIDLAGAIIEKMTYNFSRPYRHGNKVY